MKHVLIPVYHDSGFISLEKADIVDVCGESYIDLSDAAEKLLSRGYQALRKDGHVCNWSMMNNSYGNEFFLNDATQKNIDDFVCGKIKTFNLSPQDKIIPYLEHYIRTKYNLHINLVLSTSNEVRLKTYKTYLPHSVISKSVLLPHRRAVVNASKRIVYDNERIELLYKASNTEECDKFIRFIKKFKMVKLIELKSKINVPDLYEEKSFKEKCIEYFKSIT